MRQLLIAGGVLFILLAIRFHLFYQNVSKYSNGQFVSFQTTLFNEPQIFTKYQTFSINTSNGQRIFVAIPRYPEFHYGDTVRISGTITLKEVDGAGTSLSSVPKNKKIVMTMYFPKIEASKDDQNFILALTSSLRQHTTNLFEKTLPPTSASLLLGIVFGIKENMDKSFADALRTSGVSHVIAASGMNVTMVGGFLSSLLVFFLSRRLALLCTILGIMFYAILAGLEPSIIRASIMGILVFSAQTIGRQYLSFYGLFLAAYGMLFVWPPVLFDIGFQLSFLATLGLIFIRPLFEKSRSVKNILEKSIIGESVVTTITAQLATLPILLVNFGTFSLWSVVVNGLVLWVVPTLMVLGGAGAVLGLIIEALGQLFLYLTLPFLLYFQKIVTTFAGFGAIISLNLLPWQFIIGYYLLLVAGVIFFSKAYED